MAESDEINTETLQPSFPAGRVKRIMKLDTEKQSAGYHSDALSFETKSSRVELPYHIKSDPHIISYQIKSDPRITCYGLI
ncbi:hypothetical protein Hanom_Chr15g01356051 [Helianthus anomalus]